MYFEINQSELHKWLLRSSNLWRLIDRLTCWSNTIVDTCRWFKAARNKPTHTHVVSTFYLILPSYQRRYDEYFFWKCCRDIEDNVSWLVRTLTQLTDHIWQIVLIFSYMHDIMMMIVIQYCILDNDDDWLIIIYSYTTEVLIP